MWELCIQLLHPFLGLCNNSRMVTFKCPILWHFLLRCLYSCVFFLVCTALSAAILILIVLDVCPTLHPSAGYKLRSSKYIRQE